MDSSITTIETHSVRRGAAEDLQCIICHNILWKPLACASCLNNFCGQCITQWLTKKNTCPSCVGTYKESRCAPLVINFLAKLKFSCKNERKGCKDSIPYDSLEKHERDCGLNSVTCKGCKIAILQKDTIDHEMVCTEISVICDICQLNIKRKDEKNHKNSNCAVNRIKALELKLQELQEKYLQKEQSEKLLKEKFSKLEMQFEEVIMRNDELILVKHSLTQKVKDLEAENPRLMTNPNANSGPSMKNMSNIPSIPRVRCIRCNGVGKVEQQIYMGPGVMRQQLMPCPECKGQAEHEKQHVPKPKLPGRRTFQSVSANHGLNFGNPNNEDELPEKQCSQQ